MENLFNKNTCRGEDLYKLSPDYKPLHLLLRMQLRRTLVKDTHTHNSVSKISIWSRKSIKKSRNCFNNNRDIVKLQNDFNKMNKKNLITLKYLESFKSKHVKSETLLDEYFEDHAGEDQFFLHEIANSHSELVICNDNDFKLNMKSKPAKLHTQSLNCEIHKNSNYLNAELHAADEDILLRNREDLKVKCVHVDKKFESNVHCSDLSRGEVDISKKDGLRTGILDNNGSEQESDLQKLLIMMAISSKPNKNDENFKEMELTNSNIPHSEIKPYASEIFCPPGPNNDKIENILSVTPIRVEINDKQIVLMKKFINKWKQYVHKRKKYIIEQRQVTLNSFFDKINKKKLNLSQGHEPENKAKHLVRDYSTYQHRYKVQKHIIALQKAKLEEQNRLIEELKYNKIIEASRKSVDIMREEVRKTYYEIDRQLKPKIKCLTNELNIHEIEEPSLVLHCLKVPQFLQRMEKRAREREEKHAIIRERRRQMEEERIRLKQQAELAKAEMDKEEKIRRIKELKEKRKKEKIENIRRKQYAERMRALIVMADLHYEKCLMAKYGIRPLRILIEIKRDNADKAIAHYQFQLKKNIFLQWMWYTEDMWFERNFKAEELYRKNLLRKLFERFKMNHYDYVLRKQVAEDYYELYVTQLVFRKLCEGVKIAKKEQEIKWKKAVLYHNSNLLFKVFTCWRSLPALNALKREQEARKARWREKVLQVVPDYTPPKD